MEGLFNNFVPSELVAKLFQLCDCSSSSIIKVKRSGKRGWQVKLNFVEKCDDEGSDGVPENTVIKYRRVSQFHCKRDFNRFIELKDIKRKDACLECSKPEFIPRDFVEEELVTPTAPPLEFSQPEVSEQALLRNEHVQLSSPDPGGADDAKSSEVRSLDVLPISEAPLYKHVSPLSPVLISHESLVSLVPPDDVSLNVLNMCTRVSLLPPKLISESLHCKPEPEPPDSDMKNNRSSYHGDLLDKYLGLSLTEIYRSIKLLKDEERAEFLSFLNDA